MTALRLLRNIEGIKMVPSINDQKETVKRIRQETGYSVIQIIKALRCCNWDTAAAIALLHRNNGYSYDRWLPK